MDNLWVQVIGTLLVGGKLLNFLLPAYFSAFATIQEPKKINEYCFTLGGKIHRKSFIINNLIYSGVFIIFLLLAILLKNFVMYIILFPYFVLLVILQIGNLYKRTNAITDKHKLSIFLALIFSGICVFQPCIKNINYDLSFILAFFQLIFGLTLVVYPSKKINDEDKDVVIEFEKSNKSILEKFTNKLKLVPKENYHILGYITVLYLGFIVAYSIYDSRVEYGYYEILRWLVFAFSVWTAFRIYKRTPQNIFILIFASIAILFNPIIKVVLDESAWFSIDIVTAIVFIYYGLLYKKNK